MVWGHGMDAANSNDLGGFTVEVMTNAMAAAGLREGTTATANEQGYFNLELSPDTGIVLQLTKDGYLPQYVEVDVTQGETTTIKTFLRQSGASQAIDPAAGGTVEDTDSGGSITIPPNALVKEDGTPAGSANVTFTAVKPSAPNYMDQFPGSFLGIPTGSASAARSGKSQEDPSLLQSYGIVNINAADDAGSPLYFVPSEDITIRYPVDPTADPGATVPSWYLNFTDGIWRQTGTATKSGDVFETVVSGDDFAGSPLARQSGRAKSAEWVGWGWRNGVWMNIDRWIENESTKRVTVRDIDGNPVQNATVYVRGNGYQNRGYTNSSGVVELTTAPSDAIAVWAVKGNVGSSVVSETAAAAGQTKDNTLTLSQSRVTFTMQWGADPSDLDAHLFLPDGDHQTHVYYNAKGSLTEQPYALLDTDDRSSYGPEIVTITRFYDGTYHYLVKNYSGQAYGPIEDSGCSVTLLVGGSMYQWNVPTSNPNNHPWWHVCNLETSGDSATVTEINTLKSDADVQGLLPSRLMDEVKW